MTDEKKNLEKQELNLEELEEVTGGGLKNVRFTKTSDITDDIKQKIKGE